MTLSYLYVDEKYSLDQVGNNSFSEIKGGYQDSCGEKSQGHQMGYSQRHRIEATEANDFGH